MTEIELEKTYLARSLPSGLESFLSKQVKDIYLPLNAKHPTLRIRQQGDRYEITKKQPMRGKDSSEMFEYTIDLTEEEFVALEQTPGKKLHKIRYYYDHHGTQAEIDIFQDDLLGLVLIDFEFAAVADKDNFQMPEFCLTDVTQDECFAGGVLCGKKYTDVETHLDELGYNKLLYGN